MGLKPVRDNEFGIYLWKLPDGKYFQDGEGNFLMIPSRYGDIANMADIAQKAKYYGQPVGRPVFIPNAREVTDGEHDDQMERMLDGKLPDPYDVGALRDSIRKNG